MKNAAKTIVVTWVENTGVRITDEFEKFDGYNFRPKVEVVPEAKACIWLNKGTDADAEKALAYIQSSQSDAMRVAVYQYPTTEKDPLGRARREITKGLANAIA